MSTPPNSGADAGDASATGEQPLPGARLVEELRLLVDALAERAQPVLDRFASGADQPAEHTPATCGWCPLCAGMAVLRGERPELAVRAAEHAAGLLSVLRASLADRPPAAASEPAPEPASGEGGERVQRIPVRRKDSE